MRMVESKRNPSLALGASTSFCPLYSVVTERETISVNFGRPVPIFPLDGVVLLPQQVLPLHIFEERYVQMVGRVLDGSGQIALAVFEGEDWKKDYNGTPPIRPYVCLGQIAQHEPLPGDRYNILLQGVCRARVVDETPPDEDRLYREAMLEPVGIDPATVDGSELEPMRQWNWNTVDDSRHAQRGNTKLHGKVA